MEAILAINLTCLAAGGVQNNNEWNKPRKEGGEERGGRNEGTDRIRGWGAAKDE